MVTHSIQVSSARPTFSGGDGLRQVWTALSAIVRTRRTRRLLLEMDSRLLADIGISRGDAIVEAGRPFWDTGLR